MHPGTPLTEGNVERGFFLPALLFPPLPLVARRSLRSGAVVGRWDVTPAPPRRGAPVFFLRWGAAPRLERGGCTRPPARLALRVWPSSCSGTGRNVLPARVVVDEDAWPLEPAPRCCCCCCAFFSFRGVSTRANSFNRSKTELMKGATSPAVSCARHASQPLHNHHPQPATAALRHRTWFAARDTPSSH